MQPGKCWTEKCVQFNKASSNCLQEVPQPQSFQNVPVNPMPWQLHTVSSVCYEEAGQLWSRFIFLLLSYASNLDQMLCLESPGITYILPILCNRYLNNVIFFSNSRIIYIVFSDWPKRNIDEPNSQHESEYTPEGSGHLVSTNPSKRLSNYNINTAPSPLLTDHRNVWQINNF